MIEGTAPETPRDLRTEGAPSADPGATNAEKRIGDEPYDPSADRENVRGNIAMLLLWTLVAVVAVVILIALVTAGLCGYYGTCVDATVELKSVRAIVELVLTPLIGLVGAVTGFYFGEKSGAAETAKRDSRGR